MSWVLIYLAILYQQCFLTSQFGIKQLHFTLFALAKDSDISPLKDDTLHNEIIQTVARGLPLHVKWRSRFLFLLLLFSKLTFLQPSFFYLIKTYCRVTLVWIF